MDKEKKLPREVGKKPAEIMSNSEENKNLRMRVCSKVESSWNSKNENGRRVYWFG